MFSRSQINRNWNKKKTLFFSTIHIFSLELLRVLKFSINAWTIRRIVTAKNNVKNSRLARIIEKKIYRHIFIFRYLSPFPLPSRFFHSPCPETDLPRTSVDRILKNWPGFNSASRSPSSWNNDERKEGGKQQKHEGLKRQVQSASRISRRGGGGPEVAEVGKFTQGLRFWSELSF